MFQSLALQMHSMKGYLRTPLQYPEKFHYAMLQRNLSLFMNLIELGGTSEINKVHFWVGLVELWKHDVGPLRLFSDSFSLLCFLGHDELNIIVPLHSSTTMFLHWNQLSMDWIPLKTKQIESYTPLNCGDLLLWPRNRKTEDYRKLEEENKKEKKRKLVPEKSVQRGYLIMWFKSHWS